VNATVQVVSVIGPIYSITLPNLYRVVLHALKVFYIDVIGELFIPTACLGGYASFLLIKAILPFFLLMGALVAYAAVYRCKRPPTHPTGYVASS